MNHHVPCQSSKKILKYFQELGHWTRQSGTSELSPPSGLMNCAMVLLCLRLLGIQKATVVLLESFLNFQNGLNSEVFEK